MILDLEKILHGRKRKTEKQKREILERKYRSIRTVLIRYYEDVQTSGVVDIPPFMLADDFMKRMIKSGRDIEFYHRKLRRLNEQKSRLCEGVNVWVATCPLYLPPKQSRDFCSCFRGVRV